VAVKQAEAALPGPVPIRRDDQHGFPVPPQDRFCSRVLPARQPEDRLGVNTKPSSHPDLSLVLWMLRVRAPDEGCMRSAQIAATAGTAWIAVVLNAVRGTTAGRDLPLFSCGDPCAGSAMLKSVKIPWILHENTRQQGSVRQPCG
jgi:hypothetical protein